MRFILPLLLLSTVALAADDYQRIVCIDDPKLTVTLLLKPVATPADEDFVGWELDNHTDRPLKIYNANYRLSNVVKSDRDTGKGISEGNMASGNPYDLLWRDGHQVTERREDVLPPGVTRRTRFCSVYSLAITGFPRSGAWTLAGHAHIQISLDANTHLATAADGVPFKFQLLAPDDKAIAAMAAQLQRRLGNPSDPFGDAYALKMLLGVKEVAATVDLPTLLAGLKRADFVSSSAIVEHIDRTYPTDDRVIAFWIDAADHDNDILLGVLEPATHVRGPKLVEPLAACVERWRQGAGYFALRMLHRQRDLMPDRDAMAKRLSRVVLKQAPWLEDGNVDFQKHVLWQEAFDNLALTGDPAMTNIFLPYLDRKDVVIAARQISLRITASTPAPAMSPTTV